MDRGLLHVGTTFALAWASALVFLVLRCQREGRPFGPTSRWWAFAAISVTSVVSTAGAFAGVALLSHIPPALLGVVVPSGIWLTHLQHSRTADRRRRLPEVPPLGISLLLARMEQSMAEDRLTWCEERIDRMWPMDRLLAAARAYHTYVKERVPPADRPRVRLDAKLRAIEDRLEVATVIESGASQTKVRTALRESKVAEERRYKRYRGDLMRMAGLLRHDAEQELLRLLGVAYKFGCYRLPAFTSSAWEPSFAEPRPHP
jgi:hypothetical protein